MRDKKNIRNIKEDLPELHYDRRLSCFQYSDGSYLDIYLIRSKDLVNGDPDEIEMDCFTWAKFYKTYGMDMEIVSMMFPCDTHIQQRYWKRILEGNENPLLEPMIQRKIQELEYRGKHTEKKEFYLLCFFESVEELNAGRKTMEETMGIRKLIREGNTVFEMLSEITEKKKRQILFKFSNKNCNIR